MRGSEDGRFEDLSVEVFIQVQALTREGSGASQGDM